MSDDKTPPQPSSSSITNNANNANANANANNQNDSATPSLPSRIQSSASNLARNAFFNSTPPGDIAHSLPGASKSSGPSSSSATGAAGHHHTEASTTSGSGSGPSARGIAGDSADSFRSSTSATDQGLAEDAFQRSYHDGGGLDFLDQQQGDAGIAGSYARLDKGKGKQPETEIPSTSTSTLDQVWQTTAPQHQHQFPPAQEQNHQQDGAAVLSLLSSPSFNPDFPPAPNQLNALDADPIPTDLSDEPPSTTQLSQTEMQILNAFRRQDPNPPRQRQVQQRLTSTSLIPDIGSFLDTMPPTQQTGDTTTLRDTVLTGLPGAEDWVSVEEMYQDEVWGYLKPALQAAAKEMEEKDQGQGEGRSTEDGPAVARLKMILRHMGA